MRLKSVTCTATLVSGSTTNYVVSVTLIDDCVLNGLYMTQQISMMGMNYLALLQPLFGSVTGVTPDKYYLSSYIVPNADYQGYTIQKGVYLFLFTSPSVITTGTFVMTYFIP